MHNYSSSLNGESDAIMVPTRPILDALMEADETGDFLAARHTPKFQMVTDGLNGLLYPDTAHLYPEQKASFDWEIAQVHNKLHFTLMAPKAVLEHANLDRISSAGTSIVAGIIYAPTEFAHTREMVRTVLDRSEVVDENSDSDNISIVFQGGARISDAEYQFAKQVGAGIARYNHAPKRFITGGGRGIMRAPHSGAVATGTERGFQDTKLCGVSCGKIIAAEPPNGLIKNLAVFEQIERRLEAFTRSGQLTVFFPGGTGTFEELLYVLAVLMDKRNEGIHYSFLMVGSEENREHYEIIMKTLETALGEEVIRESGLRDRLCIGTPDVVAQRILKDVEVARQERHKEMLIKQDDPNVRMDFHGDIYIPGGLREPFRVTRESVANLQLHRNQSISDSIVNLRRLTYTVTCCCMSTERDEVAKNGPFQIYADPEIGKAIDMLFEFMKRSNRMNGGEYNRPYVSSKV